MTCGCRVECEGTDGAFGATACDAPTITYCPMHANAARVLEIICAWDNATRAYLAHNRVLDPCGACLTGEDCDEETRLFSARASAVQALRAITGAAEGARP